MTKKDLTNREQAQLLRENLGKKPNLESLDERLSALEAKKAETNADEINEVAENSAQKTANQKKASK